MYSPQFEYHVLSSFSFLASSLLVPTRTSPDSLRNLGTRLSEGATYNVEAKPIPTLSLLVIYRKRGLSIPHFRTANASVTVYSN